MGRRPHRIYPRTRHMDGLGITAVKPLEQIRIAYSQGFHTGWGVWRFTSQPEYTLVSFEMRIVPKNPLYGLVYRLARVPRRHAAHMQELFTCLEGYLKERTIRPLKV